MCDKRGAKPITPAPSTTVFSISNILNTDKAIYLSRTVITLSTNLRAIWNAFSPTVGTAKPSAKVGVHSALTGFPSCKALVKPRIYLF